jgi:hypothetical protein
VDDIPVANDVPGVSYKLRIGAEAPVSKDLIVWRVN